MQTELVAEPRKVPLRVILLNFVQVLGILAAALAVPSPETAQLLAMLPEAVAGNVGKIAVFLLASKPTINAIADLVDNGKIDGSWKAGGPLPPAVLVLLLFLGAVVAYFAPYLCAFRVFAA